jgi:heme a synthase
MVVLVRKLTTYRLSITEWKPVTGSLPPMSEADWASEFLKYQSSPEFHLLNSRMTLEEFKSIYWMEWIHRVWGRAIGLTFVLPAIYFVARRQVSRPMALRVFGIAGLIGFQGFLGWWMVKSGLKDDLFAPGSHPRVSQYRLTAHLGAAFIVYTSMLWNGLSILRTNKLLSLPPSSATLQLTALRHPALRPFKIATAALCALVFATAMSGGLVAGLDAGLIYNDFPYMGVGLTPPKSELFDKFYSHVPADERGEHSDLIWRNMLENPSLVQLDHRIMATTTFTAVMALFAYSRFSPNMFKYLPLPAKKAIHGVVGFAWLQVILGISTLLYLVPTPLASAHQAGSLALLSYCFVLGGRVWVPRAAARVLEERISQGAYNKVVGEAMRKANTGTALRELSGASGMVMAAMPLLCLAGFFASTPRAPVNFVEEAEAEEERCLGVEGEQKKFLRRQKDFKSCESRRML